MNLKTLFIVFLIIVDVNADCASVIQQSRTYYLDSAIPIFNCYYIESFVENVYQDDCDFSNNEEQTVIVLAKQALNNSNCSLNLQELINKLSPPKACYTDMKKCFPSAIDVNFKNPKPTCNDIAGYVRCVFGLASCQFQISKEFNEKFAQHSEIFLEKQGFKCPFKILDLITGSANLPTNSTLFVTVILMLINYKIYFASY